MEFFNIIGLLLVIAVLVFLSFRGVHTVLSALLASIVIIISNGMNFGSSINTNFMTAVGSCVVTYFLLFALGAVFGEVMSKKQSAGAIAKKVIDTLGRKYVILVLSLVTVILSYAGISIFVIVFVIYPLAVPLMTEANISKNILLAVILFAGVTLMLPAPFLQPARVPCRTLSLVQPFMPRLL